MEAPIPQWMMFAIIGFGIATPIILRIYFALFRKQKEDKTRQDFKSAAAGGSCMDGSC